VALMISDEKLHSFDFPKNVGGLNSLAFY